MTDKNIPVELPNTEPLQVETHPWSPFIPHDTKILIMGTFPPQPKRWAMNFYYPNRTNDFWFVMGLIFFNDRYALYDRQTRTFRLDHIMELLSQKGIALNDTCHKIQRLMGNASDKFLKVIQPVDLDGLLSKMPGCRAIATTGEKAAEIIGGLTGTQPPKMGEFTTDERRNINIWRMPSTSRAYPLRLEKKAEYYQRMFIHTGVLK